MKPLRVIAAVSLIATTLCAIAGPVASDSRLPAATAGVTATWPWIPKGGDPGPFVLPSQVRSLPSKTRPARWSYDWPLKPFGRPHPVRAYLNDPRISADLTSRTFHFGIDISATAGTPIYAILAGTTWVHGSTVYVRSGTHTFEYWHIVPAVASHRFALRHTLLGRVRAGFNHVHLSERQFGRYVNPLRAGGIGPFSDSTAPQVLKLTFRSHSRRVEPTAVKGTVDLVADAADIAAGVTPAPWPVTPALLRWRITRGGRVAVGWRTAYDFRVGVLPTSRFDSVYAEGTRMNHPGQPGYYCFLPRA